MAASLLTKGANASKFGRAVVLDFRPKVDGLSADDQRRLRPVEDVGKVRRCALR
jgi:hypothetical protein